MMMHQLIIIHCPKQEDASGHPSSRVHGHGRHELVAETERQETAIDVMCAGVCRQDASCVVRHTHVCIIIHTYAF